jgi:hypothetical protein
MRKSEQRLRDLHPFAMARYDRLRADGLGPVEAMRETAPLFALSPRARAWPFAPVRVLDAGTGAEDGRAADRPARGSEPTDLPETEALEPGGRSIVTALQERARAAGREPLGQDELRTVLETVSNLPADVIDRVIRPGPTDGPAQSKLDGAAAPGRTRAADIREVTGLKATLAPDEGTETQSADRDPSATRAAADLPSRTAQPWQRDFPVPIREVVAAAAVRPASTKAPRAAASRAAASWAARPGGPGHA